MNNLVDNLHTDVYANIKRLMENARTDVAKQVNNILGCVLKLKIA